MPVAIRPGMQTIALLDVLRDPSLIPFVYDYCNQWCRHCPVAARCLYYRTRDQPSPWDPRDPIRAVRLDALFEDGKRFARAVIDATGSPVAQLDYDLTDPERTPGSPAIGDPLERLARDYMLRANRFLVLSGFDLSRDPYRDEATPEKIVGWYHILIASKTYRALVATHRARHGVDLEDDALACAKLVLVSIDQSMAALDVLNRRRADAMAGELTALLTVLRRAVDQRFPRARAFARLGLDAPLAAAVDC
jgi:hypothetical protein